MRIVGRRTRPFTPMSEKLRPAPQTGRRPRGRARTRDAQRAEFLLTHFHRQPGDVHLYDMILNTSLLGEELCADLIVQAAQTKQRAFKPAEEP